MLSPTGMKKVVALAAGSAVALTAHPRLAMACLKTVGEVREISDEILLSFNDCGKHSVAYLREALGLPSTDGVRPR